MPSFYGWCDLCLKFYPISNDEFEKQVVEFAQIYINDDPEVQAQAGKTTLPGLQKEECHRAQTQEAVSQGLPINRSKR